MTTLRSKPSAPTCLARKISAIPPSDSLRTRKYLPKGRTAAAASLAWAYWEMDGPRVKALAFSEIRAHYNVYKYLEEAAKHPSPSYYQLVASLLVREHRSDEAVAVMFKAVALDPSDPLNYVGLAEALNFNDLLFTN